MTILLTLTQLITGLMAGLYVGWAISVLPGLWRLQDIELLRAFQHLNRAILNPAFISLFTATVILAPLVTTLMYLKNIDQDRALLLLASILLILGHAAITVMGNIPINQKLDKINIENVDASTAKTMRDLLQVRWRYLHWARTLATSCAFGLLLMTSMGH